MFDPRPPIPMTTRDIRPGVHWKTPTVTRAMTGRFFVWIDDETTDADTAYLAARHPAGAVVYRVDPAVGLLAEDLTTIRAVNESVLYRGPHPGRAAPTLQTGLSDLHLTVVAGGHRTR